MANAENLSATQDKAHSAEAAGTPRFLSFAVTQEQEGETVGHLLKSAWHIPGGMLASLKWRDNGITRNGAPVHTDVRLRAGDTLCVRLDEPGAENPAEPVPIPLLLRYEDADLAVVEKPQGLLVHGAEGGAPTLANALAARWGRQAIYPVHRLDRGTTGLLVVAKNAYSAERLRRALHTEDFVREYLALASGCPAESRGLIDAPLGPADGVRGRICVRADGREARTRYQVLGCFPGGSLLRLRLETGRTHQIRVHLASLGCPLFGDTAYGGPESPLLARPALHAAYLRLTHPVTGERLTLASPLPEDLRAFLHERDSELEKEVDSL